MASTTFAPPRAAEPDHDVNPSRDRASDARDRPLGPSQAPPLLPTELDALSRRQGTTVADLCAALPASVHALSPLRSLAVFARSWLIVAAGEVALHSLVLVPDASLLWRLPALVALWVFVASGLVGLFVLGHDCGHESFSRSRFYNSLVGHLCMSPLFTGFHTWRVAHNHHHARTQLRHDDPDWPERMLSTDEYRAARFGDRLAARLAYGTPAGLLVGFIVGAVRRTFMATMYPQVPLSPRTRRQLRYSNALMIATSGGTSVLLCVWLGPSALFKHYLVPAYFGMVLGALFTYLHHAGDGALVFDRAGWTPMRGQVISTFDVRFPRWFELLFLHINRHLPHHVAPRVPWYHLPAATDALVRAYPEYHQPRRFSIDHLRRALCVPLLEDLGDGVYITAGTIASADACRSSAAILASRTSPMSQRSNVARNGASDERGHV